MLMQDTVNSFEEVMQTKLNAALTHPKRKGYNKINYQKDGKT